MIVHVKAESQNSVDTVLKISICLCHTRVTNESESYIRIITILERFQKLRRKIDANLPHIIEASKTTRYCVSSILNGKNEILKFYFLNRLERHFYCALLYLTVIIKIRKVQPFFRSICPLQWLTSIDSSPFFTINAHESISFNELKNTQSELF